ncbi:MAG: hypothetical protein H6728_09965 [Myxococcales bacterium]|nr:hypothetical protein [Myxococcales bacterium]MCB9643387.1 hypothetical protein [Myxococcales bacterium]
MQDIQPIYQSFSHQETNPQTHKHQAKRTFRLPQVTSKGVLFLAMLLLQFPLMGCKAQTWTQPVSEALPWLSWMFWGLGALSALTFLVGLEQEHDSLSISGLVLLGLSLLWFGYRIFPLTLQGQAWLWILLQVTLVLGFCALAALLLFRSLEDGFHLTAWIGFLLIFFCTLPYTRATNHTKAALSLPLSLQSACFGKKSPPRTLSPTAETCVRLARLSQRLQYRLQHEIFPLHKDYTQRFQESWPLIQDKYAKLPQQKHNLQGIEHSLMIYDWKRIAQIALFQKQLDAYQKTATHTLAQSRFYLWELTQLIRLQQQSLAPQKQHYLEAERQLDQLLRQTPIQWLDRKQLALTKKQLLQKLQTQPK